MVNSWTWSFLWWVCTAYQTWNSAKGEQISLLTSSFSRPRSYPNKNISHSSLWPKLVYSAAHARSPTCRKKHFARKIINSIVESEIKCGFIYSKRSRRQQYEKSLTSFPAPTADSIGILDGTIKTKSFKQSIVNSDDKQFNTEVGIGKFCRQHDSTMEAN